MNIIFFFFLLLLLLAAVGAGKPNTDCLSRDMTTTINGYFLTTVFMTHFIQYLSPDQYHAADRIYIHINRSLGQLIVALFLFYSGYGIMESIKNKEDYLRSFLRKRVVPFILQFEIAVFIYLIVSCVTEEAPTVCYAIQAFFAWESLGNSNWYVFAIVILYLSTYIIFRFLPRNRISFGLIPMIFLSLTYIAFMSAHKGGWWYDTILCYPAGMAFSLGVSHFRRWFCQVSLPQYLRRLLLLLIAFVAVYPIRTKNVWCFELLAILFSLTIVVLTARFRAYSPCYSYIGKNLFVYYIYQRIPMILFQDTLGLHNIYLYFIVCLAVTIGICLIMTRINRWIHDTWLTIASRFSLSHNHIFFSRKT